MTSGTLTVITLVAAIVAVAAAMISKARAHDPYNSWQDRNGFSCCNDQDCGPTRAHKNEDGLWHALVNGRWIPIPPDAVLSIPSPDGRSHVCMGQVRPRCFVPGETRS